MSMSIALKSKDVSVSLLFITAGIEIALLFLALLLDILIHLPLYTFGRFLHYFLLCFMMLLVWSGLANGKLKQIYQILFFAIIPNIEFFLINFMGYSNLWGLLFLAIYCGILSAIFDIDLNNGGSFGVSGYSNKIIKSAIKGLSR